MYKLMSYGPVVGLRCGYGSHMASTICEQHPGKVEVLCIHPKVIHTEIIV